MKKIAFLLLFCFSLTQVLPAAMSIAGNDQVTLFITDEEKNQEESGKDKEGKKIKIDPWFQSSGSLSGILNAQLRLAADDKLPSSPVADVLQPPPNK
ncbi:MAG: hypothetical protein JNM88_02010 [Chitinophagaceae bacterium]|nr:hypothetical protein [Chitinophagaceae bacterium]